MLETDSDATVLFRGMKDEEIVILDSSPEEECDMNTHECILGNEWLRGTL